MIFSWLVRQVKGLHGALNRRGNAYFDANGTLAIKEQCTDNAYILGMYIELDYLLKMIQVLRIREQLTTHIRMPDCFDKRTFTERFPNNQAWANHTLNLAGWTR